MEALDRQMWEVRLKTELVLLVGIRCQELLSIIIQSLTEGLQFSASGKKKTNELACIPSYNPLKCPTRWVPCPDYT